MTTVTKLKAALAALEQWAGLIDYQYTGTSDSMNALQHADNAGQGAITDLRSVIAEMEAGQDECMHLQGNYWNNVSIRSQEPLSKNSTPSPNSMKSELEQFRAIRPKLLAELKEISAIFRELGKVKK
jgi:hypothetical protein